VELKNFFAQDAAGNAMAGATCYLYQRGTETLVASLRRANGTPLPNPFTADAQGAIKFAAPNGLYDLLVTKGDRSYRIIVQCNDVSETVDAANAAAARAEVARDAAQLSAGLYADTAAGLVATANNQYFSVPSVEQSAYLTLYRNSSGAALYIKQYPSADALAASNRVLQNIVNPNLISAINGAQDKRIPRGPLDIVSGLVVGGMYKWYTTRAGVYETSEAPLIKASASPMLVLGDVGTGQSLSIASRGTINTVPGGPLSGQVFSAAPSVHGDRCLMLSPIGVRVFVNAGNYTPPTVEEFTGLEPIHERFDGEVCGETIWSSYTNRLYSKLKADGDDNVRLLPIVSGRGNATYSQIKKGTTVWQAMFNAMTAAQFLCEQRGWTYRVGDLDVMHGESEVNTPQATYEGYLREWLSNFRDDAVALTGQSRRSIRCMFSQTNTGMTGAEGVAMAMVHLHETEQDFCLYAPKYQFAYYDGSHLMAEGYVKVGELKARAKRFWLKGQRWDCLRPTSAVLQGSQITVAYNNTVDGTAATPGPIGPIVLDTVRGKNPSGKYGFYVSDTNVSIMTVTVNSDQTSLTITLSAAPATGTKLKYAIGEVLGGAVRDSDERERSSFDNDPLYNFSAAKVFALN
jgi:hypothetical protein